MHRPTMCTVLSLFMLAGAVLFVLPAITGHLSTGRTLMIVGISVAVGCGFLRCYFDGECAGSEQSKQNR